MFNAGGYNDAANQFAGGGFMPSQAPDSGMKEAKKGNAQGNQTLRAVNIRQLIRDVASTDDDTYVVDGVDLHNVTVLGKVVAVQDSNTSRLVLTINDGTGEVSVTSWSAGDDNDQQFGNRRIEHAIGSYVRVFGHVRVFDKQKSVQAFKIAKVHDSNEITYHNMQCLFQHVHLTRGGAGRPMAAAGGAFGAAPAFGNQAGGWNNQQQPMQQQNYGNNGAGNGMTPVQNAVFQILSNTDDAGVSVELIVQQLGPQGFNRTHITQALEFLQNEGHAFTTVDENHWKSST